MVKNAINNSIIDILIDNKGEALDKRIEELLKGESKTDLINNRLLFFEKFKTYYNYFREHLLEKRIGYQGLQYRSGNGRNRIFRSALPW